MRDTVRGAPAAEVLPSCTLPVTGLGCVSLLVTELGVFDFPAGANGTAQMRLVEIAPGLALEELRAATAAEFVVAEPLKEMAV